MPRPSRRPALALALALLAACGGGGGGAPAPLPVEGLAAAAEDRAVLLSWTALDPAFSYRLAFSTQAGFDPAAASFVDVALPPFLHDGLTNGVTLHYRVASVSGGAVGEFSAEVSATPQFALDPLLKDQWHLDNTGQNGAVPGEDVNARDAWAAGFEGDGTVISIVDDGLEVSHPDLLVNVVPGASHSYVDGTSQPTPGPHGTCCGGIAAGRGGNGIGVSGAAPRAGLVGYDFLSSATVANQADAMVRGFGLVDVSSNSWGPEDGTGDLAYAEPSWISAVEQGIAAGRNGLGTVYVFAGGNGHLGPAGGAFGVYDNSNANGFANHRAVIAVGAVDDEGMRSVYSERGANLLVCAPSARSGLPPSPANQKITTVDRVGAAGFNTGAQSFDYADLDYTRAFDGTSASTPIVAGVAALVLQARPELSWRDVREVLATTARRNDPADPDWRMSPGGHWVNHDYGFGVVDAGAAVAAAGAWTPAGPAVSFSTATLSPDLPIPDDDPTGVTVLIPVSGSGVAQIEFVEVRFTSDHPFAPDLAIVLESPNPSPSGVFSSVLAEPHDTTQENPLEYSGWRFGSARHLGEPADGTWRLHVSDRLALDEGSVQAVQLVFHGR